MDSLQTDVKKTMDKLNEELYTAKDKLKEEIAVINAKYMIDRLFTVVREEQSRRNVERHITITEVALMRDVIANLENCLSEINAKRTNPSFCEFDLSLMEKKLILGTEKGLRDIMDSMIVKIDNACWHNRHVQKKNENE